MSAGLHFHQRVWLVALGLALTAGVAARADTPPAPPEGDPARGKTLYQNCTACHSIDDDDIGPRHRGVVGRKAGTVPGYAYSPALKASGIVWDKASLDRWLTNPSAMVPGTKMFFLIDNPQNRADIIAYLAELH
jgi:cytochrome c